MMKTYKCHKTVKARPMALGQYNAYRGWNMPLAEDPDAQGFLIEYVNLSGKPNHPDHEGYISWSPKAEFDEGYSLSSGLASSSPDRS